MNCKGYILYIFVEYFDIPLLFMEVMLGISLYNYFYLKLTKMLCISYYLLCLFNKIGEARQVGGAGRRKGPNNVCTYK
jgi:hypothetical protein